MEFNRSHYHSAGRSPELTLGVTVGQGLESWRLDSHPPGPGFSGPRGDHEKMPGRTSQLW